MKNLFVLIVLCFFFGTSISFAQIQAHQLLKGSSKVCYSKTWFKAPVAGNYNAGSDMYVKVDAQNHQHIKHIELYINGQFVRKENHFPYEWAKGSGQSDAYLRNLQPGTYNLKAKIVDKCGQSTNKYKTFTVGPIQRAPVQTCQYKSWFKYPKNNGTYRYGDDVYVRVDTKRYQDIAEMQLFVNGKFVRKEVSYPFEWVKGSGNSDPYLRNLKRGTYNLKVRVRTKCEKWYEYYCKFYVR